MKNYIPKSKFDDKAVGNLHTRTFESIRADIPELLTWLQDMNWPVAHGVAEYLRPYVNEIKDELIDILNGNDGMWKYWIIGLIASSPQPVDKELIALIKRIAEHPSEIEQADEVHEIAQQALEDLKA